VLLERRAVRAIDRVVSPLNRKGRHEDGAASGHSDESRSRRRRARGRGVDQTDADMENMNVSSVNRGFLNLDIFSLNLDIFRSIQNTT
jgi:hypothetical protein